MIVTVRDGTALNAARTAAKGNPEAPLSRADMIAKATMLMRLGWLVETEALIEPILAMPNDGGCLLLLMLGR